MVMVLKNSNPILRTLAKTYAIASSSFLLTLFISATFFPVLLSNAITCTDGSTGISGQVCDSAGTPVTVNIENPAYLTITSSAAGSGGISLDYTAADSPNLGSLITASDTVTTTSNTGQTKHLYISTSSTSNNLTNADTDLSDNKTFIAPGGGDTLAGATSLSNNTWGFALESSTNFTKVPILGSEMLIQEGPGSGSTTGEYENTATVYYGVLATTDLYAGSYSNTIRYTAYMEDTAKAEPMERITYMQDMTKDICANTKVGTATRLIDKRGRGNAGTAADASYGVLKAADGNCWMTDNLDLYNKEITSADSDITSSSFTIPDTTNYGADCNDADHNYCGNIARLHVATNTKDSGIYVGQIYYNWCSAVALNSRCNTTSQVDQSICPTGWQLPINGNNTVNKSYAKLLSTYGVTSATRSKLVDPSHTSYALGLRYYGVWDLNSGSEVEQGRHTHLWSSTPASDINAYNLSYGITGLNYQGSHAKGAGWNIRCVSRN